MEPLMGLISGLGEGIVWLIQSQLMGLEVSNVYVDMADQEASNFIWGALGALTGGAIVAIATGGFGLPVLIGAGVGTAINVSWNEDNFPDDFFLPLYAISPQEIFSDQVPALHINFINPKTYPEETQNEEGLLPTYNSAKELGPQISRWYVAIRNLVLVGLMVVLLYIGIRIVISSTAGEKAKYKEHIKDWIVAVVLVVFMHYIMAFALTITEYITNALNNNNERIAFELPDGAVDRIEQAAQEQGVNVDISTDSNGKAYLYTNLMGYARLQQQMDNRDSTGNKQFNWNYIGYTIIYIVLVIYTVMFVIIYLKRVVYMAFLTVIAPLVALTYPIDKISDGQSQAFNMWLKEYVYNLLLQPFHLLLYTLLVGSVMELATNNMLYAIVTLGFLIPAEKLLRRFFGFEKANTTESIVGGVVGGSLAMNAINSMKRLGSVPKKGNGEGGSSSGDGNGQGNSKTRLTSRKADKDKEMSTDQLIGDVFGSAGDDSGDTGTAPEDSGLRLADNGNDIEPPPDGYDLTDTGLVVPRGYNETLDIQRPSDNANGDNSLLQGDGSGSGQIRLTAPIEIEGNGEGDGGTSPTIPLVGLDGKTLSSNRRRDTSSTSAEPLVKSNEKDAYTKALEANNQNDTLKTRMGLARARWDKFANTERGKTIIAGAKTGGKFVAKGAAALGKRAPRVVTKAALGAALGTAGVAAGVASGDLSNALAYGAAAAGVGATIGEGVSNVAGNTGRGVKSTAKDMRSDFERRRYSGDERRKRENARADAEWEKSDKVKDFYRDKFGKDGYEQAMKDAKVFRQHGITDDEAIAKARKIKGLKDDGEDAKVSKERMLYARAATTVKSEDDLTAFGDRMKELGVKDTQIREFKRNFRQMNDM